MCVYEHLREKVKESNTHKGDRGRHRNRKKLVAIRRKERDCIQSLRKKSLVDINEKDRKKLKREERGHGRCSVNVCVCEIDR
jgi:hypothetical protein